MIVVKFRQKKRQKKNQHDPFDRVSRVKLKIIAFRVQKNRLDQKKNFNREKVYFSTRKRETQQKKTGKPFRQIHT